MKPGIDYIGTASGVVLLNENNEIFLMRRTAETRNDHNLWSIPGGKIEYGETSLDAAIRETEEEAGVVVEELEYIGYVDHIIREENQHWIPQVYVAREWEGEPMNMEPEKCSEIDWFSQDDIPSDLSGVVEGAIDLLREKGIWI